MSGQHLLDIPGSINANEMQYWGDLMAKLYNRSGMMLIEIVVSMAIFGILAIVFLTIFTSSLLWILGAGDKGEASSYAQKDIETRIATREAVNSSDLTITFGTENYSIQGGLVETDQTIGKKSSQLETFIPLVPTIIINPMVQYEGALSTPVSMTGFETSFNSTTIVELYDNAGSVKIGPTIIPTITSTTEAEFTLPSNLLNDDYIVRVTTTISGKPSEYVRAKYTVEQPKFLSVGNNTVYISADGANWIKRSSFEFPLFSYLNSVVNNGNQYVAVGASGLVLLSQEKQAWTTRTVGAEDLMSIAWSTPFNKFYAVGAEGGIYSSETGLSWSAMTSGTNNLLNDIFSTTFISGNSVLTAVGDGGVILYSTNGFSWSETNTGALDIKAIASGYADSDDIIIAVGNNGINGIVTSSSNGSSWSSPIGIASSNFNDIAYNQGLGLFVAVGDDGLIMTSTNGSTWIDGRHWLDGSNWADKSSGLEMLNGVFTQGSDFIIVGSNRTILHSNDGNLWTTLSSIANDHLTSVAGK